MYGVPQESNLEPILFFVMSSSSKQENISQTQNTLMLIIHFHLKSPYTVMCKQKNVHEYNNTNNNFLGTTVKMSITLKQLTLDP